MCPGADSVRVESVVLAMEMSRGRVSWAVVVRRGGGERGGEGGGQMRETASIVVPGARNAKAKLDSLNFVSSRASVAIH